jgi:pimeloyl-ACP methyl ester carboxylesterase
MTGRGEDARHGRQRLLRAAFLVTAVSAALALPALASSLIRRRARPLPPVHWGRSHRYAWDLGAVAFQELGFGRPLVLLHSLGPGHDGTQWLRAAERLAPAYRVYVPDLLGWGRSEKPPLHYTPDLYLDLLEDFLAEVVREPAVLVAAGRTAAFAVQAAVDRPRLVRGLGLVTPLGLDHAAEGPRPAAWLRALLPLPIAGTAALDLLTSRAALARHLRREVYAAPERVDAAMVDHHWRAAHLPGARFALEAHLCGRLDRDVADLLPRLDRPLWLAWGRAARRPPVEAADLWLHRVPGAELEVFSGSAALPHAEEPPAFAAALGRWIQGLKG